VFLHSRGLSDEWCQRQASTKRFHTWLPRPSRTRRLLCSRLATCADRIRCLGCQGTPCTSTAKRLCVHSKLHLNHLITHCPSLPQDTDNMKGKGNKHKERRFTLRQPRELRSSGWYRHLNTNVEAISDHRLHVKLELVNCRERESVYRPFLELGRGEVLEIWKSAGKMLRATLQQMQLEPSELHQNEWMNEITTKKLRNNILQQTSLNKQAKRKLSKKQRVSWDSYPITQKWQCSLLWWQRSWSWCCLFSSSWRLFLAWCGSTSATSMTCLAWRDKLTR
jgi:hypothetical protein